MAFLLNAQCTVTKFWCSALFWSPHFFSALQQQQWRHGAMLCRTWFLLKCLYSFVLCSWEKLQESVMNNCCDTETNITQYHFGSKKFCNEEVQILHGWIVPIAPMPKWLLLRGLLLPDFWRYCPYGVEKLESDTKELQCLLPCSDIRFVSNL